MDECIRQAYRNLGFAIVLRAFEDGVQLLVGRFRDGGTPRFKAKWLEIRRFVLSAWFLELTDIRPGLFLRAIALSAWKKHMEEATLAKNRKEETS